MDNVYLCSVQLIDYEKESLLLFTLNSGEYHGVAVHKTETDRVALAESLIELAESIRLGCRQL